MNATTVEWLGAGASSAVAVVAAAGLFVALRDSKNAAQRADAAEARELADRRRLAAERRAELELQQAKLIAEMVGAAMPNVLLNPLERGRITAALDALPPQRFPLTRAWMEGTPEERTALFGTPPKIAFGSVEHVEQMRERVRAELRAEMQRLTGIAAGEDAGGDTAGSGAGVVNGPERKDGPQAP